MTNSVTLGQNNEILFQSLETELEHIKSNSDSNPEKFIISFLKFLEQTEGLQKGVLRVNPKQRAKVKIFRIGGGESERGGGGGLILDGNAYIISNNKYKKTFFFKINRGIHKDGMKTRGNQKHHNLLKVPTVMFNQYEHIFIEKDITEN